MRQVLEQAAPHITQTHPSLGLQCFSYEQIPPNPKGRALSWGLCLCCCELFALHSPRRSWLWWVAHGWSPGSNSLAAISSSVSGSLLENPLSRNPPPKVISERLCVHKAPTESSRGHSNLLQFKMPLYTPGASRDLRAARTVPLSCITHRKQSLDFSPVFRRARRHIGQVLPCHLDQALSSCVTFTKIIFLSLSSPLCEMGLRMLWWRSAEIMHRRGLRIAKSCPDDAACALHCEQDLRMTTTVALPALAGPHPRRCDLRLLFRQKDVITRFSFLNLLSSSLF